MAAVIDSQLEFLAARPKNRARPRNDGLGPQILCQKAITLLRFVYRVFGVVTETQYEKELENKRCSLAILEVLLPLDGRAPSGVAR